MTESTPLTTPLTDDVIDALSIGQHVTFTAVLYTALTAAHKRLVEMAVRGEHRLASRS